MPKIHNTPDGRQLECIAEFSCQYKQADGSPVPHYSSKEEARAAYEREQGSSFGYQGKHRKRRGLAKRFKVAGAALLASVSLSACQDGALTSGNSHATPAQTQGADQDVAKVLKQKAEEAAADAKALANSNASKEAQREAKKKAKELARQASEAANSPEGKRLQDQARRTAEDLARQGSKAVSGAAGGATSGTTRQADGTVLFQGRPLTVSTAEVEAAKKKMNEIPTADELASPGFNSEKRAALFGRSFKTGFVGRLEHRDIPQGQFKNAAPQARAIGGSFIDPYTGKRVEIVKGKQDDSDVDHIVPLHEVMESGGDRLSPQQRIDIANDYDNTQVVGSKVNRHEKSDKDAAEFLPSYQPARKAYVIAQINVKSKYGLTADRAEKAAWAEVLSN